MKWGLRVELLFILIFVICLLISTVGLNRLGILGDKSIFDDNVGKYSYDRLEKMVSTAGLNYYNDRYYSDSIIVKTSTLTSSGYLSPLYDEDGRKCTGYAKVMNSKVSVGYIKCFGYKTSEYDSSNE